MLVQWALWGQGQPPQDSVPMHPTLGAVSAESLRQEGEVLGGPEAERGAGGALTGCISHPFWRGLGCVIWSGLLLGYFRPCLFLKGWGTPGWHVELCVGSDALECWAPCRSVFSGGPEAGTAQAWGDALGTTRDTS